MFKLSLNAIFGALNECVIKMKERISLTIDKKMIEKLDHYVDGRNIKNRSHAVEVLLNKAMGADAPKIAVILAGGEGTRLRPITLEIPKPLVPIKGKPLMNHIFDLLKKYGIKDVVLSIGYKKDKIIDHYKKDNQGMNIIFAEEDVPLGTAGPLKLVAKQLRNKGTIIVTNGDNLHDLDIKDMYEHHKKAKALATIALTTVEDPSAYGVARMSGLRILEFVEKPKKEDAPSNFISSGFYLIEPEVLDMIPEGKAMLEKDVFPKLAKMGKLFGYPFSGQWFDTGTMERYETVIKEWKGIDSENK